MRTLTSPPLCANGVALLELMLVVGVIAAATAGVVATANYTNTQRRIGNQVRHTKEIVENVNAALVSRGDYALLTLNQANAIRDGMFPRDMLRDGEPKAWRGDVLLTGTSVAGIPNYGAALIFTGVPASACIQFVSEASAVAYSASVNGRVVKSGYGALDMSALTEACQGGTSRVELVHAKNGGAGLPVPGSPPPAPPVPCSAPPPPLVETIVDTACPGGMLGTRVFETRYTCNDEVGEIVAQRPTLLSDTCQRACALPSPATQIDMQYRTAWRTGACPHRQDGTIRESRMERRERKRTAICNTSPGYSAPVGSYVWPSWTGWASWIGVGTGAWTVELNTCAPR